MRQAQALTRLREALRAANRLLSRQSTCRPIAQSVWPSFASLAAPTKSDTQVTACIRGDKPKHIAISCKWRSSHDAPIVLGSLAAQPWQVCIFLHSLLIAQVCRLHRDLWTYCNPLLLLGIAAGFATSSVIAEERLNPGSVLIFCCPIMHNYSGHLDYLHELPLCMPLDEIVHLC